MHPPLISRQTNGEEYGRVSKRQKGV